MKIQCLNFYELGGFLLSWTPYTIVCMYRAFIQDSYVSPMAATIPAFFGKFSLAWPALLSLFGNKDIRKKLIWFRNNNNKKHRSTGTVSLILKKLKNNRLHLL